jgi:putative photosynthetic complex assembly protein
MNPATLPHAEEPGVPLPALWALAALLVLTLTGVAFVRVAGVSIRAPDAAPTVERLLRFEDRPDGSVGVIDATQGQAITVLQGEQGFLRGALRALARERRQRGLGPEAPFALTARADGRLTLSDTATGARLDLESFGPTNAGAFARLLTLGAPPVASADPGALAR